MEQIEDTVKEKTTTKKRGYKKPVFFVVSSLLLIVVVLASYAGYVYAMSPAIIREPALEHYHFRMQIIVDGKAEDFSSEGYQTGYAKDQCNANLPEQPIHFHDNKDQFTHVHWEGMTGGMVMKYYGWNYIGGVDNALGYKLDDLSDIQKVTTHGDYLPKLANDSKFFIYTGDESSYQERTFDDWKNLDLENFFGTTSNFPAHKINTEGGETSFLDKLLPKASAHDGVDDGNDGELGEETEEEKLTRINNLVGNVVIFAQKDAPSEQQIKDRFNNLEPLADSTCGG